MKRRIIFKILFYSKKEGKLAHSVVQVARLLLICHWLVSTIFASATSLPITMPTKNKTLYNRSRVLDG